MTVDEIRDRLAERAGWKFSGTEKWRPPGHWSPPGWPDTNLSICDHPMPATLDGAASAMPVGWEWQRFNGRWRAQKMKPCGCCIDAETEQRVTDTGNEISDRYRLAWKCVEATQPSPT